MSSAEVMKEKIVKKYSDIFKLLIPTKKLLTGLKNASYLVAGHFLSVAISFVGFIYIARLLGPSNFGIYITVGAFVGMFDLITFYGINKVILREGAKDLTRMSEYLEETSGIKLLFTIIAIGACIIGAVFVPYSMLVKLYIILYSFSLTYTSFNTFFATVYTAAQKMQYNAILTIIHRIIFVSLSILFLYMGYGVFELFIIALFSQFSTLILNFKLTKKFIRYKFWNRIKWNKHIIKPAIIFSILSFSYFLAGKIDLIMISILGSSKEVGIYGVAHQIVNMGLTTRTLIAAAFFPIFVQSYNKTAVRWKNLINYAILLGIGLFVIAAIISFLSEYLIPLLFGGEYFESAIILSVLIFYVAIAFFLIPFANTLQATHNEMYLLKICWIAPALNIGLNYLFFKVFGLIGIAYSTLVIGCVSLPLYIIITRRALKIQNKLA